MKSEPQNAAVAARLGELAALLQSQGANRFRVEAYARAADLIRDFDRPVGDLLASEGLEGFERLPAIGTTIARAIRDLVETGRLPMLERLRSEGDAITLLMSVPGIGRTLADRLHRDHGIDTLEDLEAAAHDGRLAAIPSFGAKRLRGVRETLAARLGRVPRSVVITEAPSVAELLRVDREYRLKAVAGTLRTIAPRRFNPGQYTVVTASRGPMQGKRTVRGREAECLVYYGERAATRIPSSQLRACFSPATR